MQNSHISLLWLVPANLDLSPDVTQQGPKLPRSQEKKAIFLLHLVLILMGLFLVNLENMTSVRDNDLPVLTVDFLEVLFTVVAITGY